MIVIGLVLSGHQTSQGSREFQNLGIQKVRWTKRDVFVCVNSFLKNAKKPALFHTYDFIPEKNEKKMDAGFLAFFVNEVSYMK